MFPMRPSRFSNTLRTLSFRSIQRGFWPLVGWTSVGLGLLAAGCGGSTEKVSADVCKSGIRWTGGDSASEEMNPGQPCLDCHARNDGPHFSAGGTVYVDPHASDDCFGQPNVEVHVTDATGKTFTTKANAAGNFFFKDALAMPYQASVTYGGMTLPMSTRPTTGDCNSCHTKNGAGVPSPGKRIFFPVQ
jgi:hypothetical protein